MLRRLCSSGDVNYLTLFQHCTVVMILFGCLVMLRVRGITIVRFSFDTGYDKDGKCIFSRYGCVTDEMMLIQSA